MGQEHQQVIKAMDNSMFLKELGLLGCDAGP
jgi:hypothetical protein